MKTTEVIEGHYDEVTFGWMDDDGDFRPLDDPDTVIQELTTRDDFRKKLIEAINFLVNQIKLNIGTDLKDIWKRLDRIEGK